jgi:DNA-binding MarR family transcriptional regulator
VTAPSKPRPLVAQCLQALRNLACQTQPPVGVWSELDLTMSQLKAVFALNGEGSMSVGHLAHVLAISEPSASVLVDRLQGAELALREADPHDKRKIRVVPTAKAIELSERLMRVKEELMAQWLERLSDDDLRALLRGAEALLEAAVSLSYDAPQSVR